MLSGLVASGVRHTKRRPQCFPARKALAINDLPVEHRLLELDLVGDLLVARAASSNDMGCDAESDYDL